MEANEEVPTIYVDLSNNKLFPVSSTRENQIATLLATKDMIDEAFIWFVQSPMFREKEEMMRYHILVIRSSISDLYNGIIRNTATKKPEWTKFQVCVDFSVLSQSSRGFAETNQIISDVFFCYLNNGGAPSSDGAWLLDYTRTLQFLSGILKESLYAQPGFTY